MPEPFNLEAKRAAQAAARADIAGRIVDLDLTTHDDTTAHLEPAAIANCHLCDGDGYTPARRVCDHHDHAAAAARHMPEIRAILQKGQDR